MTRVVLVLGLALLTLHAGQPPHLHKGVTPGAYNEEHVLASLESATGDVPLPDRIPTIAVPVAVRPSVPTPDIGVSSEFARHAHCRAPPLA